MPGNQAAPRASHGVLTVDNPVVGELQLEFDKFAAIGAEDQVLVLYRAELGSRSAVALALLTASVGDGAPVTRRPPPAPLPSPVPPRPPGPPG